MLNHQAIQSFFAAKAFALIGVSKTKGKFGNYVLKELTAKGFKIFPVHPLLTEIEGIKCHATLGAIPEPVNAAIIVVHPSKAVEAVRQAHQAGIRKIWLQQGAASPEALEYGRQNELEIIHGECVMMFAEPVQSIHKFHRWVWKVIGRYPR